MDGTLIESERHLAECSRQASAELGLALEPSLWLAMIGLSEMVCRQMLHARLDEAQVDALQSRTLALYERRVEAGLPLRPGVRAMLDWAEAAAVPRAVVTSTRRERAERKLARCDLRRYFEHVVTGSDVREAKPAPDIYLLAADVLGVAPSRCIVLEDSVPGVRAALAAGMTPIQVPDMVAPDADARRLGHRIADDLAQARRAVEAAWARPD
ncbi:HAD family phosphatase [Lysobacter aestuarii]|uniref:HAD family phosphatase n=2 Tax=Marilutibacter aestuarii TaxID=1706195 RepID=A0A507ZVV1_9GAMM|nr:HAD family phosphatase [Lysobacter aestuarii]